MNKCIEINATIRSFLTDNDINLLMVHYLEVTRLVGASKAKKIAKAVSWCWEGKGGGALGGVNEVS